MAVLLRGKHGITLPSPSFLCLPISSTRASFESEKT
jgi:hypothetical protein